MFPLEAKLIVGVSWIFKKYFSSMGFKVCLLLPDVWNFDVSIKTLLWQRNLMIYSSLIFSILQGINSLRVILSNGENSLVHQL